MNSGNRTKIVFAILILIWNGAPAYSVLSPKRPLEQEILEATAIVIGKATNARYADEISPSNLPPSRKFSGNARPISMTLQVYEVLKGPITESTLTIYSYYSEDCIRSGVLSIPDWEAIFLLERKDPDTWWVQGGLEPGHLDYKYDTSHDPRHFVLLTLERDRTKADLIQRADAVLLGRVCKVPARIGRIRDTTDVQIEMEVLASYKGESLSPTIGILVPEHSIHNLLNDGRIAVVYLSGVNPGYFRLCGGEAGISPLHNGCLPCYLSAANSDGMPLLQFKDLVHEALRK